MPYYHRLLAIAALLAAAVGLQGCSSSEAPLRIGTNPWPGYLGLYYARDLGLLGEADFRLVQFDSTEDVLTAFRNRAIDAAAVTLDEALVLAENQQSPRIILVFDTSNGADVVLARPGINHPGDLRHRKLGLETNALGAYMLARLLQTANIDTHELELRHITLPEHVDAYRKGMVDAIITFDPPRAQLLADGAKIIFSSANIPGEIVDVLIVREETLQQHGEQLKQLIANYFIALNQLRQDPEHAARTLASDLGMSSEDLLNAWSLMDLTDAAGNRQMLAPNSNLQATMARLAQIMVAHNLLDNAPAIPPLLFDKLVSQQTE